MLSILKNKKLLIAVGVIVLILLGSGSFFVVRFQSYPVPDSISDHQPRLSFADVDPSAPYFTAMGYLRFQNILTGDEKHNIYPDRTVTRAEWAEILTNVSGVVPDPDKYGYCYTDIHKESFAPAVCYAKEQGWLAGEVEEEVAFHLVPVAYAMEDTIENFRPTDAAKNKELAGSLARFVEGGGVSDEEAFARAVSSQTMTGGAEEDLTRGVMAEAILRTATVDFTSADEYDAVAGEKVANNFAIGEVLKPKPDDKVARTDEARANLIRYFSEGADGLGVKEATRLVDAGGTFREISRRAAEINYQKRLDEEKAVGKEQPRFNMLDIVRPIFEEKGGSITIGDFRMYGTTPYQSEEDRTDNPIFLARDSVVIYIDLDKNFQVIPRSDLGKRRVGYHLEIKPVVFHDIEHKTPTLGDMIVAVTNAENHIVEWSQSSRGKNDFYPIVSQSDLTDILNRALRGVEIEIGQPIMPSRKVEAGANGQSSSIKNRRIQNSKNLTSAGSLNCAAALSEDDDNYYSWDSNPLTPEGKKAYAYKDEKESVEKKDGDFCQISRYQESAYTEPSESLKITYHADIADLEKNKGGLTSREDASTVSRQDYDQISEYYTAGSALVAEGFLGHCFVEARNSIGVEQRSRTWVVGYEDTGESPVSLLVNDPQDFWNYATGLASVRGFCE